MNGGLDDVYQGSVGHALKVLYVDMEFDLHGVNRCRAGDCCLNRSTLTNNTFAMVLGNPQKVIDKSEAHKDLPLSIARNIIKQN